ncbi:MAG TPA: YbfB/YjiJ family MFS transporter [Paraburkholderia sp.]|jgi:predicted MFS family arabinose efflux permease|nr:YbfB/YjiJ family MFS transporter [Paraburkholderia sp.]
MTPQLPGAGSLGAQRPSAWRYIFAGLCASLASIGLARFAYTPLLPSLIQAHWFATSDAVYLGAANLMGYLIGALIGRPLARHLSNAHTLRLMMVIVTAAFFACGYPLSVAWFFVWRLLSGIAGGAVMVLVAATVMPHVPGERKGLVSGALFLGLGLGIAASGTIVPLLLNIGLRETWLGLGVLSAVLTAATWSLWPSSAAHAAAAQTPPATASEPAPAVVRLLYVQYAVMAFGVVPTMVFLVDFIARGLHAGAHLGALCWVLYGVGAIAGPPVYGALADRLGGAVSIRIVMLAQAVLAALLAMSHSRLAIGALAVLIGSFPPGIVPLMLARVHEVIPGNHARQNLAWSRATILFAACQAIAGYAYSSVFNASGGNHRVLFALGAVAFVLCVCCDLFVPRAARK